MRELFQTADSFDLVNCIKVDGILGDCYIFHAPTHPDYADDCRKFPNPEDNKVFIMQKSACLKSHYTPEDIAHRERMNKMVPLKAGEIVLFEGKEYKVRILGNYSDCGRLDPVNA